MEDGTDIMVSVVWMRADKHQTRTLVMTAVINDCYRMSLSPTPLVFLVTRSWYWMLVMLVSLCLLDVGSSDISMEPTLVSVVLGCFSIATSMSH